MSDKYLTVKEWQKFAKEGTYKDAAFLKALAAAEKGEREGPLEQLKLLYELEEQGRALLKLNKGDKKLESYLEDVNKALKKYRKEAEKQVEELAEQEAEEGSDNDSPVLLQHKMIPLLREIRKGAEMQALIGLAGKDAVVLLAKRSIAPARRELLMKWLGVSGGVKWIGGRCLFEANAHTFIVEGAAAGLAKKLKAALLAQVELRLKVRVRGEDPNDVDEELGDAEDTDGDEDEGGEQQSEDEGADRRAEYERTKKAFYPRISAAVREGAPNKDRIVVLMGLAQKSEGVQDWAEGIALYAELAALLPPAPPAPIPQEPSAEELRARFEARSAQLTPLALAALKAQTGDVSKIRAVADFAREKGEGGNYKAGLSALDQLEKLLGLSQGEAAARPDPAAAFNARLAALMPRVKAGLAEAGPAAQALKLKVSEAGTFARKQDFDAAHGLLDEAEALLGIPGAGATSGAAPPELPAATKIAFTQSRLEWERMRKQVQADLRKVEAAVLEACKDESDFSVIARNIGSLYTVLDRLDERLIDTLDEALNADSADRRRALQLQAREIVDEYRDYVKTEELLRAIDENGFVDVGIVAGLNHCLGGLAQQLRAATA